MTGLTLSRRKYGDLDQFAEAVRVKMSKRILNLMAEQFSDYVKRSKLSGQVLSVRSGRTRNSMGFFQLKRARTPTYVIRPGRNVDGHLNYLGGMQRGMLLAPKHGEWLYIRERDASGKPGKIIARVRSATVHARPFMTPAWKEWRGNASSLMRRVYGAYAEREFGGTPDVVNA